MMSNSRRKFFSRVLGVWAALKVGLPKNNVLSRELDGSRTIKLSLKDFHPSMKLTPELLEKQKTINNLTRKLIDSQRERFERQAYETLT